MGNISLDETQQRELLRKTVESKQFENADRLRELLTYLVEKEIEGGDAVNAYFVASDVFGRDSSFDPAENSLVRVEMHRLRAHLKDVAADEDFDSPYRFVIQPRSYRPSIIEKQPDVSVEADDLSKTDEPDEADGPVQEGQKSSRRQPWQMAAFAAAFALIVLGSLALFVLYGTSDSKCDGARPQLLVGDNVAPGDSGVMRTARKELLQYLEYYPTIDSVLNGHEFCDRVPTYSLKVENSPTNSLTVTVTYTGDGRIVFFKRYPFETTDSSEQRRVIMARVASDLANTDGAIPLVALSDDWNNRAAEKEFSCLMSAHAYFIVPDLESRKKSNACLKEQMKENPKADSAGLLAAFQLDMIIDRSGDRRENERIYQEAVTAAEKLDPFNSELLITKLRAARVPPYDNIREARSLADLMLKKYPYQPNVLNQVAIAEAKYIGEPALAKLAGERSDAINGSHPLKAWKMWLNLYQDRLEGMGNFVAYTTFDERVISGLLIIGYAEKTGNAALKQKTRKIILEGECNTRACIQEEIESEGFNLTSQMVLERIADANFPN